MRVAIVNLTNGGLSGGYVKHLNRIVPLLANDKRIAQLDIFVPGAAAALLDLQGIPLHKFDQIAGMGGALSLKAELRRVQPNVVFVPTARSLPWHESPTVVMVRNMEALARPLRGKSIHGRTLNVLRRMAARRACAKADRIIAVSGFVKEVLESWAIPSHKIGRVYHGVDQPVALSNTLRPCSIPESIERPFLFTAGSIRPERGLEDIIKALALCPPEAILVIAGQSVPGTRGYERRVRQLSDTLNVRHRIIWAGQLSSLEMSWCFHHCAAFVMSSRVEACPNVVLEAMAHGCLSLSTDTKPMPEFFGDAALYFHEGEIQALAALVQRVCSGPADERYLREKARARSQAFSWEDTAAGTVRQLQLAIATARDSNANAVHQGA
jgi:glycosyltransferase involved in cell wall biosynthesis